MDVREKLVELLAHSPSLDALYGYPSFVESAEWLIDHGVTVQGWVSVNDMLPEDRQRVLCFKQAKQGSCVMIAAFSKCLEKYCDVDFHGVKHGGFFNYDSEVGYYELSEVTHWMPLPQPPKGE